jgi:hypothetical protein
MGNGLLGFRGCNPFCCGAPQYKINNNVFENYGEVKLDKDKKIITNIFIPNSELNITPETTTDKKHKIDDSPLGVTINQSKTKNFKSEKKKEKRESGEIKKNLNKYFDETGKRSSDKSVPTTNPVPSISTYITQNNKIIIENHYNIEFLEYINKMRTNPSSIVEDINLIMKNNLKVIDDKDCIISEQTNEIIKLVENFIYFDNLKDYLENIEPVNALKLNDNLKIKYIYDNFELTDKMISEIVLNKKKEIINNFPNCYFYPLYIKDIKFNIFILLSNNRIKEKLFSNKFSEFYVTVFNIKNNRFFSILCFA